MNFGVPVALVVAVRRHHSGKTELLLAGIIAISEQWPLNAIHRAIFHCSLTTATPNNNKHNRTTTKLNNKFLSSESPLVNPPIKNTKIT